MASVPEKPRRLKNAVVPVVLGLVALGVCAWVVRAVVMQELWLVNGLHVPVHVAVDGRSRDVPAEGRASIWVLRGAHQVRATTAKGTIEDEPIVVRGDGIVAYNVLGAAPLYAESVHYSEGGKGGPTPTLVFHGGTRVSVSPNIDYVFEEPPQTISMDKGSSVTTRWRLAVAPGGWAATVSYLSANKREADALRVCRGVQASGDEQAAGLVETLLAEVRGREAPLNLAREKLEAEPADVMANRYYQYWARVLDRKDEAQARYQAAYQADPSPLNATFLARLEPPDSALNLLHAALARDPAFGLARRTLATVHWQRGDFAAGADLLSAIAKDGDAEYRHYVDDHAWMLAAAGRAQEAAERVAALAVTPLKDPEALDWRVAVTYARLARLPGVVPPKPAGVLIDALAKGPRGADFAAWMWTLVEDADERVRKVSDEEAREIASVHRLAGRDPAAAWGVCRQMTPAMLRRLAPSVALLLAAEYDRVGDLDLADVLLRQASLSAYLSSAALRRYAREGTSGEDDWRLHPELRAALDLVYGRRLEAAGQDGRARYEAARRADVLRGIVSRAIETWPRPRPAPRDALVIARAPVGAGAPL